MATVVSFKEATYGMVTEQVPGGNPAQINYYVAYAGKHTTVGGAPDEIKALPGVLATDILIAELAVRTNRLLLRALPAANQITFTFDGDPLAAHQVDYVVLRAA